MTNRVHHEPHYSNRNNWLRASVLGANDGLISTASLLMGMTAANSDNHILMLTGMASLVAGAISMAAGEYVSVSSQADTEKADLNKEAYELLHNPKQELDELIDIYKNRGLSDTLAQEVATALTAHNALDAHARDEIGLTETTSAKPLQASLASAASFMVGAIVPIACVAFLPSQMMAVGLAVITLLGLSALGAVSARLGGAKISTAVVRVVIWGVVALGTTALIGQLFGVSAG